MRMYILSDKTDTLAGMRLAGIEGSIIKSGKELENFVNSNSFEDIAILMITKSLVEQNRKFVDKLKERNLPLVVEVPDSENCEEESDSITRYVREAMGIKI